MRLSTKGLRVVEVVVGLVAVLFAYQTTAVCIAIAINPNGGAVWFSVFEGLLSVGLWVAAYGLLFKGTNWRRWKRSRIR